MFPPAVASKLDGFMEQALRDYIRDIHEAHPGSIGDMLNFSVVSCNEQTDDYVLECETAPWMCNHYGTLHGGICATILDQAMGMVCVCLKRDSGNCTTVQLEADYHRPVITGSPLLIRVHVVSVTRSLINMTAELVQNSKPDKISVSGSAIFFCKTDDLVE